MLAVRTVVKSTSEGAQRAHQLPLALVVGKHLAPVFGLGELWCKRPLDKKLKRLDKLTAGAVERKSSEEYLVADVGHCDGLTRCVCLTCVRVCD